MNFKKNDMRAWLSEYPTTEPGRNFRVKNENKMQMYWRKNRFSV